MKEGRAGQGRAAEHARAPARGEEDPTRYNGRSEGRRPASCAPADRAREEGGATLPTTNRSDVRPTSERPPPAPHRQNSPTDVGAGTQRWHPQPVPQPVAAGVPRGGTEEGSGGGGGVCARATRGGWPAGTRGHGSSARHASAHGTRAQDEGGQGALRGPGDAARLAEEGCCRQRWLGWRVCGRGTPAPGACPAGPAGPRRQAPIPVEVDI